MVGVVGSTQVLGPVPLMAAPAEAALGPRPAPCRTDLVQGSRTGALEDREGVAPTACHVDVPLIGAQDDRVRVEQAAGRRADVGRAALAAAAHEAQLAVARARGRGGIAPQPGYGEALIGGHVYVAPVAGHGQRRGAVQAPPRAQAVAGPVVGDASGASP